MQSPPLMRHSMYCVAMGIRCIAFLFYQADKDIVGLEQGIFTIKKNSDNLIIKQTHRIESQVTVFTRVPAPKTTSTPAP